MLYWNPVEPCSTLMLIPEGASIRWSGTRSVNRLKWLCMFIVDIRALWRPGVSALALVDGLHWSRRCLRRICQSFDGVELAHYVDGSRWSQSLVYDVSTTELLFVVDWNIWRYRCRPQAGLLHTHCPSSVDDAETLASYSLLEWNVSSMSSLQVIN